ncbi:MAG: response regulator transcription factor [Opitutaceae bacterium]|nr:response regulator transcription factor [Opitutaceae bacterium]
MPHALLHESVHSRFAPLGRAEPTAWPTILLVDSDVALVRTLVCHLERRGFHVAAAASLAEAREYLHRRKSWTLVISECHLPDGTGWELHSTLKEQGLTTPFLLLSSSPFSATLCAGADFLAKPFSPAKLEARVNVLTGK